MCTHKNTVFAQGERCCTDCGTILDEQVFIMSYSRAFSYRKQPIYSRQKRFYHFLQSSSHPEVWKNMEDIMLCFSFIEFHWSIRCTKTRIYFFNRFVVLVFILNFLGKNTDGMRTLKDKERVVQQFAEISRILENLG